MSKRAFSGLSSNGTLKKRMIGSGKDEDHDVDKMVSHYTDIIIQQKDKKVTGLGSKILNNPTMVRTIYFIIKFGFIVFGLAVCAYKTEDGENFKKVALKNIGTFITNVLTSMKQNPQDFGAITSGLGQLTSGVLRPIGSLLSKIPIIGSVINLFSMIETGIGNMNKFITDKILGSLYDQNFMLKLMTLYDTIPVKDSNGRHQWTPANYIKGSAILLSIMNALICGKENKVCRLSKLLEKVAYFVPVVMMIHGDILVAREAYSSGKQSFIGPMEEMDSTKKARFCRTLIRIATKSASGLFASENEKINRSAVMMGDQAVKIRKMLILTKAEKEVADRVEKELVRAKDAAEKKEQAKIKEEAKAKEEYKKAEDIVTKKIYAKEKAERKLEKTKESKLSWLNKGKRQAKVAKKVAKLAEKKDLLRKAEKQVQETRRELAEARHEKDLGPNVQQIEQEVKKSIQQENAAKAAAAEAAKAAKAAAAAAKAAKAEAKAAAAKADNTTNATTTNATTTNATTTNATTTNATTTNATTTNATTTKNTSATTTNATTTNATTTNATTTKADNTTAAAKARAKLREQKKSMSFLNNQDTSIDPNLNPDFIRDVVTRGEKNVAQRKVAAEARKAAARLAPSGISFLSGLFGSKKNKKKNKKTSIKKSNKKKSNKKKN